MSGPSGRVSRLFTNVIKSTNWMFSPPAGALACAPFSMIVQNGHAVTTVPAPVS